MAQEHLQINLAVSLHAANDQLRQQLVPINLRYPLTEVLAAVREYIARTHRRVSFEYTLNERDQRYAGVGLSACNATQRADLPRQPHPS